YHLDCLPSVQPNPPSDGVPDYLGFVLIFKIIVLVSIRSSIKPAISLETILRINAFLDHLNLGERTIKGCIEAYSCKHTGTDKRLSLSLENEILDYVGNSPDVDSASPVEYLSSRSSRKMLIYLILTLYHMYPDYDFSAVKAHQFFTEETWDGFKQIFDSYMSDASKEWIEATEDGSLLETLYKALDEVIYSKTMHRPSSGASWGLMLIPFAKFQVINLAECEVYSYDPNSDADPFIEKGALWSYNFFFYNRKLKRVVSFRFSCLSNLVSDGFPADGYYEEDGEIFDDMDM
ncbi:Maf1 regulator, partial [Cynara cardunculus var. scolymus]